MKIAIIYVCFFFSDSTGEMIQEECNLTTETLSTTSSIVSPVLKPEQRSVLSNVIAKPKIQSTLRVIRPLDKQTEEKYKNAIAIFGVYGYATLQVC